MGAAHLDADLLQDLVGRWLRQDDEAAIERLVRLTRRPLLAAAHRVARPEDADDAVQVAYLSLVRRRGRELEAPVFPWLLVATLRVAYRRKAARKRQEDIAAALARDRGTSARPPEPGGAELAALVREKIARLPERYRDVLYLHHVAGLAQRDVARLLDAPVATIRTRLFRGRALLRGRLPPRLRHALCLAPWWLADHLPGLHLDTGGLLMTKKGATATLLLLSLAGIGGWAGFRLLGPGTPPRAASGSDALPSTRSATNDAATTGSRPTLAAAGRPAAGERPTDAPATPGFSGTVVDGSGRPLPGVRVEMQAVLRGSSAKEGGTYAHLHGEKWTTATDRRGAFSLADPFPAVHLRAARLLLTGPGRAVTRARVPLGEPRRIVLGPGGDLRARVFDPAGRALAEADVGLMAAGDLPVWQHGHRTCHPLLDARSDATGRVGWRVQPGRYRLHVRADGYPYLLSGELTVRPGSKTDVALRLAQGVDLVLRVLDGRDRPIPGAKILVGASCNRVHELRTDAAGVARARGFPRSPAAGAGNGPAYWDHVAYWFATAEGFAPAEGSCPLAADPGAQHVEVRLERGHEVRVRVVDDAGEALGYALVAVELDGNSSNPLREARRLEFEADEAGHANLGRLTARMAHVAVRVDRAHETVRATLDVREAGEHQIVLARRGAGVQGHAFGPDGRPMAGLRVGWSPAAWSYGKAVALSVSVDAQPDGGFSLEALSGGQGYLVLRAPGYAPQRHLLDLPKQDFTRGVVVRLEAAGRIGGRLRTQDGTPVAGQQVSLWRPFGVARGKSITRAATTRSRADGRFAFLGVPEGVSYRLGVAGPAWHVADLSAFARVRRGDEDLDVLLRSGETGVGVPLRLRITAGGAAYRGPLTVSWGEAGQRKGATEEDDDEPGVRRFGIWDGPGTYALTLEAPGYRPTRVEGVRVANDPRTTPLDVALERGAELELHLLDAAGRPLARQTVVLTAWWKGGFTKEQVRTDDRGDCRLGGFEAGTPAQVRVRLQADSWTQWRAAGLSAPASATATLRRGGSVDVTCAWTYGELAGPMTLRLLEADGTLVDSWTGEPDAAHRDQRVAHGFTVHEPGTYRVEAECADRTWSAETRASPGRRVRVDLR